MDGPAVCDESLEGEALEIIRAFIALAIFERRGRKKKKKEIPLQLVKRGPIFLNSFDVRTRNLTKKTPRQRFRSNLNFTRIYEKEGGINICVQLRKELERFHHPSKGHNKVSSSPSSFSSSGNVTGDKLLSSAPARGETRWSVGYHVNTIT